MNQPKRPQPPTLTELQQAELCQRILSIQSLTREMLRTPQSERCDLWLAAEEHFEAQLPDWLLEAVEKQACRVEERWLDRPTIRTAATANACSVASR